MSSSSSSLLLRSALLSDIAHGFSTRHGGVSEGRYATLNLGAKWGDDPAAVVENRRRVAAEARVTVDGFRVARQVHGRAVVDADAIDATALASTEADAVIASEPQLVPAILTADCVPILLADDAGRVAAVHAGWRGTVAAIVGEAVARLVERGAERDSLRAAIGPSICADCFEVGDEVAAQFDSIFVHRNKNGKAVVDLWGENRRQLIAAGLAAGRIDIVGRCTMHEPDNFFSFRRDGAGIGQMLSFIAAGAAGAAGPSATRR